MQRRSTRGLKLHFYLPPQNFARLDVSHHEMTICILIILLSMKARAYDPTKHMPSRENADGAICVSLANYMQAQCL